MGLAQICNSSQNYIAEIESGKRFPSPAMIESIAAALQIESFCLFKNEPVPYNGEKTRLSPSQKHEIAVKINSAVLKIIEMY